MRRGGQTSAGYPKASLSRVKAERALNELLYLCTAERLAGFTAAGLSASYNVPIARVEAMLSDARGRRG